MIRAAAFVLFALAGNLSAGVISSGGGRILGFTHNPWFLSLYQSVRYCIEYDLRAMDVSLDTIESSVKFVLDSWNRILIRQNPEIVDFSFLTVGTKTFSRVSCTEPHDLQMTFGKLNEAQKQALPNQGIYWGRGENGL